MGTAWRWLALYLVEVQTDGEDGAQRPNGFSLAVHLWPRPIKDSN